MSDLETLVRNVVNQGGLILNLNKMNINDKNLSILSKIWMNCETIKFVDLSGNKITTLENITFPPHIKILRFCGNQITTLQGFVVPISLKTLESVFIFYMYNMKTDHIYSLWSNQIKTLHEFVIPNGLRVLKFVLIHLY